jgi:hypothetical protein
MINQYAYKEFDSKQKEILCIELKYDQLADHNREYTVSISECEIFTNSLALNSIFSFQEQFKTLNEEKGITKFCLIKGTEKIKLNSDEQLKDYFKELIIELKNKG